MRAQYAARFRVYTPDRRGHGRTPDVEGPIDFERLAADTIAFLEQVVGGPADLVGFSDGATTALHVALRRPDLVRRMVMISGQFHRDGLLPDLFGDDLAAAAAGMVAEPAREALRRGLAGRRRALPGRRREDHADARSRSRSSTSPSCRACRRAHSSSPADDDAMRLEHTLELYRGIPDAELAVVPGTSHVLILEKPDLVARLVLDFLTTDPVPTRIPIRRK